LSNVEKVVVDSDILIDHLRGLPQAREFLKQIEDKNLVGYVSVITEAELASGKRAGITDERERIQALLGIFRRVIINSEIAWTAGEFRRKYGCRLMDALIAATAYHEKAKLVTRNLRHFEKIREITVEAPY